MNRRIVIVSFFSLSLLVVLVLWREQVLPAVAKFLDVGVSPQRIDCLMALPGDAERRPFVAAAFVNVGLADTLLIPKNLDEPDVIDGVYPSSAEIARRIYVARHIPAAQVVTMEGASQSTADDLELLGAYLDGRSDVTAGIVTSGFHTRRTRWAISQRLPHHVDRIKVISAPNPKFSNANWWRSNVGFRLVVLEYFKLAFYWFKYGWGVYWLISLIFGLLALRLFARRRMASTVDSST